jgi:hypothetical protein
MTADACTGFSAMPHQPGANVLLVPNVIVYDDAEPKLPSAE